MTPALDLARTLKDTRDGLRLLWGDEYAERVKPYRDSLRRHAAKYPKIPLAQIALRLSKRLDECGVDPTPMAAAFVDECGGG